MLNKTAIKDAVLNIGYVLDDLDINFDYDNSKQVESFIQEVESFIQQVESEQSQDTDIVENLQKLKDLLKNDTIGQLLVSREDVKDVYKMLQNRDIHPSGEFDKQGRFYLKDGDLVNVRAPSVRYPYSEMKAGRTLKFVKAVAMKYGVTTKEELIRKVSQ